MSINRGMDKEDVVHIYTGILLGHKKSEIMPFVATQMHLETVILKQGRHRNTNIKIALTRGISKNDAKEPTYKTETDPQTENQPRSPRREGVGRAQIRSLGLTDTLV